MTRLTSSLTALLALAGSHTVHAMPVDNVACEVNGTSIDDGVFLNNTIGDRPYLLWIPSSYNDSSTTTAPLILSYHGATRTSCEQAQLDTLSSSFFNTEYLVAYPQGINSVWQGAPGITSNDTGFTSAILDELESTYRINTTRIFATGKSQGGGFANVLACDPELSVRIAAFAPVAGAFYQPKSTLDAESGEMICDPESVVIECNPGRENVPLLQIHGGADATIAYDGGPRRDECLPSIPYYVETWAGLNNISASNISAPLTDNATVYLFGEGEELGLVTHVYAGDEVGHSWPATIENPDNGRNGDGPASFNASSVILEFFGEWYGRGGNETAWNDVD